MRNPENNNVQTHVFDQDSPQEGVHSRRLYNSHAWRELQVVMRLNSDPGLIHGHLDLSQRQSVLETQVEL